ncbi:MAG TPA: nucleoid occlusion factor SlmA, partial [Aliidiomarina sp.]|nr:nucleoid occlusion factor SlmA [Aliidiomarina sp.]
NLIEDILLGSINRLLEQEKDTMSRVREMILILFRLVEESPGMSRVLTGDALMGEHERLRQRIVMLFDKLESQMKQVLRERRLREGTDFATDEGVLTNVVMAYTEGKLLQFVRSGFKTKPSAQFETQWALIERQLLGS